MNEENGSLTMDPRDKNQANIVHDDARTRNDWEKYQDLEQTKLTSN